MLLNDQQIFLKCKYDEMITPFESSKISKAESSGRKVLSFGLSSYGYDFTLAPSLKKRRLPGNSNMQDSYDCAKIPSIIDPKKEKEEYFIDVPLIVDKRKGQSYFVLEPGEFYLGVTKQKIKMPNNLFAIVTNKSTLARCGIDFAITTIEPSWEGFLTLEVKNNNPHHSVRLYANEGCMQALFFEGEAPKKDYGNGKYQNQSAHPQIAK